MKVIVNFNDKRWKKYQINFDGIANLVKNSKNENAEISIVLTNDLEIKKLNKQYRFINKATNVLSFETGDEQLLGDIFISFDTIEKEATEQNKSFENHTAHIIIHGVLHLFGYDHINEKDAVKMENMEIKILKNINIKNPYLDLQPIKKTNGFLKFFKKITDEKLSVLSLFSFFVLGAVSSFGFAPFYFWYLTIFGIGFSYYLLITILDNNKKTNSFKYFLRCLSFGAGYAIFMFWWVLHSIFVVPELAAQFAIFTVPGIIGIGLFGGLIFSIPFLSIRCGRLLRLSTPILFAATWAVVLWFREWFLTGFPWNPIANITMVAPVISNSMSLFGAVGLTFIFIGLVAGAAEIIKNKKQKYVFFPIFIFILLLIIGCFFGYKNIKISNIKRTEIAPVFRIVQPAKSAIEKATHSREQAIEQGNKNIQNLIDLTKRNPSHYDVVVFPETSFPYIINFDNLPFVKDISAPVIIGAMTYNYGSYYNSLVIANTSGDIEKIYSKSHLVPFGEYRPFGNIIPTPGLLTKGGGAELLEINIENKNFVFAPAICYEIVFSDSLIPKNSNKNPSAIINITNDTWFGNTPGTYQHLDMVRRYAIESGMPIIRSNYSGISANVGADGSVISSLGIGVSGTIDASVANAHSTIYRRAGRNFWIFIIIVFSAICLISIRERPTKD